MTESLNKLFAISIALSTLGALPAVAKTEVQSFTREDQTSVWLVLVFGEGLRSASLLSLPMKSMDQCEEQGAIWMSSERTINRKTKSDYLGFECLEGR